MNSKKTEHSVHGWENATPAQRIDTHGVGTVALEHFLEAGSSLHRTSSNHPVPGHVSTGAMLRSSVWSCAMCVR